MNIFIYYLLLRFYLIIANKISSNRLKEIIHYNKYILTFWIFNIDMSIILTMENSITPRLWIIIRMNEQACIGLLHEF